MHQPTPAVCHQLSVCCCRVPARACQLLFQLCKMASVMMKKLCVSKSRLGALQKTPRHTGTGLSAILQEFAGLLLAEGNACAGHMHVPAHYRRKPAPVQKPESTPEAGRTGGAGGSPAPETPEQVFTPKQDRHGSRSLDEVCPCPHRSQETPAASSIAQECPKCKGQD